MSYCTREDIEARIGLNRVEAAERDRPNAIQASIDTACAFVNNELSPKYYEYFPFDPVPPSILPIAVSIAVYYLLDPINKRDAELYDMAMESLKKLREGETQLFIQEEFARSNFSLHKTGTKYNWRQYYNTETGPAGCQYRTTTGY